MDKYSYLFRHSVEGRQRNSKREIGGITGLLGCECVRVQREII
jgi:hypothetical protein